MIKVNGRCYHTPGELRGVADGELIAFQEEWFNDAPYVIGHTSGSTGISKEIKLSKKDMKASAGITNAFFGIDRESTLYLCLSTEYIAGKMMVVRALEAGANLLVGKVSSLPLAGVSAKIDLLAVVPMQMERIIEDPGSLKQLENVRNLLIGGAPVSPELEEKLKKIPSQCFLTYGMTETVSHIALRELNKQTAYEALGEVSFSVDERECLVIHAPHLSCKKFYTNDVVRLVDRRHFEWLGRHDYVINSGGIKFFPEVLEKKLSGLIEERFFISSKPDRLLGKCIVLAIEGEKWGKEDTEELVSAMKNRLSKYECPRQICFIPRFTETYSKKIIRNITGDCTSLL